jgi:hypothetical protein
MPQTYSSHRSRDGCNYIWQSSPMNNTQLFLVPSLFLYKQFFPCLWEPTLYQQWSPHHFSHCSNNNIESLKKLCLVSAWMGDRLGTQFVSGLMMQSFAEIGHQPTLSLFPLVFKSFWPIYTQKLTTLHFDPIDEAAHTSRTAILSAPRQCTQKWISIRNSVVHFISA